ncbi:MAG: hypothetical protein ACE5Z5_07660 [Candidatus Bathyarchaeia archaeon]
MKALRSRVYLLVVLSILAAFPLVTVMVGASKPGERETKLLVF